jgi:hypothetical protein
MQKQFASFNTFVSRQTLPISSCDGLCTEQNDTAAMFTLVVTLPSFAQNFPKTDGNQIPKAKSKRVIASLAKQDEA